MSTTTTSMTAAKAEATQSPLDKALTALSHTIDLAERASVGLASQLEPVTGPEEEPERQAADAAGLGGHSAFVGRLGEETSRLSDTVHRLQALARRLDV